MTSSVQRCRGRFSLFGWRLRRARVVANIEGLGSKSATQKCRAAASLQFAPTCCISQPLCWPNPFAQIPRLAEVEPTRTQVLGVFPPGSFLVPRGTARLGSAAPVLAGGRRGPQRRFSTAQASRVAVGWYHFGVGEFTTHSRTYFSGGWDVHRGYDFDFDPWCILPRDVRTFTCQPMWFPVNH